MRSAGTQLVLGFIFALGLPLHAPVEKAHETSTRLALSVRERLQTVIDRAKLITRTSATESQVREQILKDPEILGLTYLKRPSQRLEIWAPKFRVSHPDLDLGALELRHPVDIKAASEGKADSIVAPDAGRDGLSVVRLAVPMGDDVLGIEVRNSKLAPAPIYQLVDRRGADLQEPFLTRDVGYAQLSVVVPLSEKNYENRMRIAMTALAFFALTWLLYGTVMISRRRGYTVVKHDLSAIPPAVFEPVMAPAVESSKRRSGKKKKSRANPDAKAG